MKRFLRSKWLLILVGILIYIATTWLCLKPGKIAARIHDSAQARKASGPPPGPSWTYANPELDQILNELKEQREALKTRTAQLEELQARLQSERQEIYSVTQTVYQLRTNLDASVLRVTEEEAANLKRVAKVYATMTPEGAARILRAMEDDQIVKLLALMKDSDSAKILESLGQGGNEAPKRAALISNRLRLTLLPNKKNAPL